ncbi:MAG: hypothetical protein HQL67_04180 [Magnetococcales bacterium]|nr:hypothetical protein [Magnetococcales bacterium]
MQSSRVIGFEKSAPSSGGRNGLSIFFKQMRIQAKAKLGWGALICPDGEVHHPSVCLRGWRGEVCATCRHCAGSDVLDQE